MKRSFAYMLCTIMLVGVVVPPVSVDARVAHFGDYQAPKAGRIGTGSAFLIYPHTWLTARHVVDDCDKVFLSVQAPDNSVSLVTYRFKRANDKVKSLEIRALPAAVQSEDWFSDTALLSTEEHADVGANVQPLVANWKKLEIGDKGFAIGFPQKQPGELALRYIGEVPALMAFSNGRAKPTLAAWEVVEKNIPGNTYGGFSGGPVVNTQGEVVGITVGSRRDGARLYTAKPDTLRNMLLKNQIILKKQASNAEQAVTINNYSGFADRVRAKNHVAHVICQH